MNHKQVFTKNHHTSNCNLLIGILEMGDAGDKDDDKNQTKLPDNVLLLLSTLDSTAVMRHKISK